VELNLAFEGVRKLQTDAQKAGKVEAKKTIAGDKKPAKAEKTAEAVESK
jgi:hypothetical protein